MIDKVKRILGLASRKTGNKLVISVEKLERRVALLENGRLEEYSVERNSSRNIAYNVGGVVICVRPEVDYFDIKFPDSVQGWRRRWLYIQEEHVDSQEYNIAPFDGAAKILRRRSWDAEASEEEKTATNALMKRIQ